MRVHTTNGMPGWWQLYRALFVLTCMMLAPMAFALDLNANASFNIAPQKLTSALVEYSRQANIPVVSATKEVEQFDSPGVAGEMSLKDGLKAILAGTPLNWKVTPSGGVVVGRFPASSADYAVPGGSMPTEVTTPSSSRSQEQALSEVVVVGSRLSQSEKDSSVPVNVYSRQTIEQSGAASVTEFLNTLPQVSTQTTTTGDNQVYGGATTVQLHGLPRGTTLVLINGRRVQSASGLIGAYGFFDLSTIPLGAVERIEVVPTGSSAIYGGDALGGVVNIVLKRNYKGLEANVRYGATDDGKYNESQYNLAAGWRGDNWSLTGIATYSTTSELDGTERPLTATADHSQYGGMDYRSINSDPGNVCTTDGSNLTGLNASCAGIPKGSTGVGLTPSDFASTAGILNKSSGNVNGTSYLSPSNRFGLYIQGDYQVLPWMQVFTEVLYNHTNLTAYLGVPGATLSVPASSPNNPFGQDVTVNYRFYGLGRESYAQNTDFVRPLLGLRGTIAEKWSWEIAGWTSRDWDSMPDNFAISNLGARATAIANGTFNPFQDGPGGSSSVLSTFYSSQDQFYHGATDSANAFVRGPIVELAAGTVEGVVGGEYSRDTLNWDTPVSSDYAIATFFNVHREDKAGFAELKVPIIGDHSRPNAPNILSAQLAVRYDRYSDFGSRTSPQAGLEFRPIETVLIRGSYGSAFKPPPLFAKYAPSQTFPDITVVDPKRGGQQESIDLIDGGNPTLQAETGWSKNIGVVWSPQAVKNLDVSLTNWGIRLRQGFTQPSANTLIQFEDQFPGHVIRGPAEPGDPYGVGPITAVYQTQVNFGYIDEAGFDFAVNWRKKTPFGEFSPSLAITETYRYGFQLLPGTPATNAVSQANDSSIYAPRWKGTVGLGWKKDLLSIGADGRYTGRYRDVTDLRANPLELGNFWYVDLNARYEIGKAIAPENRFLNKTYVTAGIRNLLDKSPAYSDFNFGYNAYDANEYDIEGRFFWVQIGSRL